MQARRPVLFLLHGLGGSARTFDGVGARLENAFEPVAIDLPGFGDAAGTEGATVVDMANRVASAIRRRGASAWLLVGHSMGGKIASVVAARAAVGELGLSGLQGVVLLAGSPPSPEPMDEQRRRTMLSWVEHGPMDASAARRFIADNTGAALPEAADQQAMADLRRTSPAAWRAWLEDGSREDWSATVGVLALPALIIVGSEDGDLGEAGQRATNMRVYPQARLVREDGAGHLLPLERPEAVAREIERFFSVDIGGPG